MFAKITTPSGAFHVELPRDWQGYRVMRAGEPFRNGDKCLTASGRLLECGPASLRRRHVVAERPGRFPVGYYLRKAA